MLAGRLRIAYDSGMNKDIGMHSFLLIVAAILVGSAAQLLLKSGMNRLGSVHFSMANAWNLAFQLVTSPFIILGTCGYAVGMIIWLAVLARMEVSVAQPMLSLGYVITAVSGYYLFGENLSPMRICGILVIILGVFLVSRSA